MVYGAEALFSEELLEHEDGRNQVLREPVVEEQGCGVARRALQGLE